MLLVSPSAPSGTLRFEWVDPSDVVRDLSTSSIYSVRPEIIGLGTAGSSVTGEKLPGAPGSVVRRIAIPPSQITLPITIIASTLSNLLLALDDLRAWFDTGDEGRQTPGYLRVTRPDGSVRQLLCYYDGGLEGDFSTGGDVWTEYDIRLYAPDPWPTAAAETVVTWTAAALTVPVGQVNEGQMAAYPIWKVTGPATSMSVHSDTSGKGWSLVFNLPAGKTVTVDTRPPSQRTDLPILDSDHVNRYPALYPGSLIFNNWMPSGLNQFTVSLVGTSGASRLELRYLPRYRGVLR